MPVGGMLIAVFAGWRMSRSALVEELAFESPVLFRVWRLLLQTIVPVSIAAILYTGL
jgi:NSS family neurotransmitter:Na+ symporter